MTEFANHHTTVILIGDSFRGGCACRQRGPVVDTRWAADDWCREHTAAIERIHLRLDSQPTLGRAVKMYQEQADNEDLSDETRALFQQLATELDHRLNPDPGEQPPLF